MASDLKEQIEKERARIVNLYTRLDADRTPYLRWRLRLASNILSDGEAALQDVKGHTSNSEWAAFASFCLQLAADKRHEVEETVNKYGGPANVAEMVG